MRILHTIVVILFLHCLSSCSGGMEDTALKTLIDSLPNASIGICIKEVETGKTIVDYNADKSLRPASVIKLLTTVTALDHLGKDYNYNTDVGYTGKLSSSTLKGSICIKASGDPTWGSKYFPDINIIDSIVNKISQAGIKTITNGFIVDKSGIYEGIPGKWLWEDIGNYYGSPSYALNYKDNTYKIEFSSKEAGANTKIKSVWPRPQSLKISNTVVASEENGDNAWIFGSPLSKTRLIKGHIPENRKSFRIKGALPDPAQIFINELCAGLKKKGIKCKPKLIFKKDLEYKKLFEIKSPSLEKIVYHTNQKSINLFAESIGKKLVSESGQTIDFGTKPTEFFVNYWNKRGLKTNGIELYDFCGLSAFNIITPAFMTDLLVYVHKNEDVAESLFFSLPLAGNSGTLKNFGKGTKLHGNLYAKTGSMKSVRAYCGYIQRTNKLYCFTIIINNYSSKDEKLIKFIVDFLDEYSK